MSIRNYFISHRMKFLNLFIILNLFVNISISSFSQVLPIKPARTISFSTDEGSYMNVDVSPDGKTILFDLLGDLYSLPTKGGNATQLTRGIALNFRPSWSPDGKRLAYISDFSGAWHLNVRDIKGAFHRVLGKSESELKYGRQDAVWTPDGNYIAVGGLVFSLTGGKAISKNSINRPIRFSADGKAVYYLDSGKLYRYDYVSNVRKIVCPIPGISQNGMLSPDGRWWVYIRDTTDAKQCLMACDLGNNMNRILVSSLIEKNGGYTPAPHYSFAPDSKSIFIGYGGKIHRIALVSGEDQVVPFIAQVKSDLGPLNYNIHSLSDDPLKVKYTRSANASPNGKRLVFCVLDKVYIMDLPNGKPRLLAPQPIAQFQPAWSPDGKWIAYVSWCDTVGGYLWRASATGGQPEQLTAIPGQYQRPVWSPGGKTIAVIKGSPALGERDDPGTGQLELISVEGGQVKMIADSIPLWNNVVFSPDGRRVIYTPQKPRNSKSPLLPQFVSNDLEGKDQRVIAIGSGITFFQQKSISPDGRYIAYSADEDLYLIPVNKLENPIVISDEKQQIFGIKFAPGVDPFWEKNGKILSWCYSNKFYRINPDHIVKTAEKTVQKKNGAGLQDDPAMINATPDQIINLNVTVPKYHAHGTIALKDVRIITMHGTQVIEHGTIVIKNGRFVTVGTANGVSIPKGAKIIDLKGKTIMPGLVDLHDHMRIPSNIFPQQSWMFLANLAYGVTTARDPSLSFDSFGYAELLASGQMIGPRLFTVGRPIRLTDGVIRFDNLDDARAVVHKRAQLGGTEIKQYTLPTRIQRQWLLMACREARLNMTNEGDYNPIVDLAMLKDGSTGIEHNPHWGDTYKDVTYFFARSGTYFTPTLQVGFGDELTRQYANYKYWYQSDTKLTRFTPDEALSKIHAGHSVDTIRSGFIYPSFVDAQIRKHGGRVTLGSHGNDEGVGAQNELWALQMGGISKIEALQAATILGAGALGIQKDVGSIEVGKIADLIILNENPLDDIHNSRKIKYVMKDGILYDGDTLDTIWPVVKKCPEWRMKSISTGGKSEIEM